MRLGASEARIGVSCTGRALQHACSIFLQGLTGRGGSCWPPFAALRCWSLLVAGRSHRNAGGSEGVGKGALCSVFSVLCVLSYSTSTVADSPLQHHPVRSGLVRKAKFAQEQHLQPAWIGSWRSSLSGGCSRTIPTNLAGVCNCTRPTSPGNVYLASFQAYIQRRSFARLLQPSFLHSRAVLQLPKKLCRLGKTASRHSSAAGRAGHPICRLCNVNSSNCRTLL
jgi:hypothetical protein